MADKQPSELWKKAFLIGLGATAATVEKIQELANELVERGEMSQKEAKSFSDDLMNKAMKEKDQFENRVKDTVDSYMKSVVKSMGLATREDIENLRAEMDKGKSTATKSKSK